MSKLMMKLMLLFIWVATLLCCSLAQNQAIDNSRYKACAPKSCGTGPNISYPFYIEGAGKDYCGRQGFRIACQNNKPIFQTDRGPYIVNHIFYKNNSLKIVDLDVVDTDCVAPNHYFQFNRGLNFTFSSNHGNVQFFYRCTTNSFLPSLEKSLVPCASNSTHSTLVALVPNDDTLRTTNNGSEQYCEKQVAVPVDLSGNNYNNQSIKTVNYIRLLKDGFTLLWYEANSNLCEECENSGGRCGTQNSGLVCFCPNGTQSSTCVVQPKGIEAQDANKTTRRHNLVIKASIAAGVSFGMILIITLIFFIMKKKSILFWKKSQTHQNVEAFLSNYGPLQVKRYSYLEVKKITNSFTEKLGQGGFGDVYKGKLDNGCDVAVKILNDLRDVDGEDFINEVATISRTSHINVVTLLGFFFEGSKRGLIYEFMPNGSLEKFIFNVTPIDSTKSQLGWDMLYQISLGIARGLEYLHRGCNTRILHFDIKPHNILLDHNFVPKITDFGLAKICTRTESLISSIMGPRGTAGYIAPEIFSRCFGGVSHKSDVYSYGMMILDMIGGKYNEDIQSENNSEIYFPHWIYKRLEVNHHDELGLEEIIDDEKDIVKVKKLITVSLWCIQIAPSDRPSMSEVIEMLEVMSFNSLQLPPKPFLSSPNSKMF
ncbi:rust resistance kinase Lr10-like [Cannabis sativa]|uniref:rust resistance kinase Lr10 n=1 Tax=Cannabis sativa TaxID=3483 RepID=UPI0011DFA129|nr:rust resistance kinase Lr10 [Cannabis sativa]XP_060964072.1 rust resistance kinase Lr10-like [Cannabis sativa]